MPEIIHAQDTDWPRVREIRLRALSADPYAFGQSWETESAYPDSVWQERVAESAWFLALEEGDPIGVVTTRHEADSPEEERELQAMWVQADFRKSGVARELADSVFEWAANDGASVVTLYVSPSNPAVKMYEALGFTDTGDRWTVSEDDPKSAWIKMARPL
ncbi:GNAT family N-acetyltransferase [Helcobacillus massiliensis]|uniref:Ribosomal protein S18 acetylase RimI-like enzyme n=1 Tax=Helcobacillus massiliensis TaxID=521392 RepID=A0A839QX04_9MICO|nr:MULTISPECIES: GNAT family N-acetyltransferase [Helcobacillus]MBB3023340.1 ribosomal protein S18 acetylase RimI-like enzyme [Helcobacillus massiliensis]MCG7426712.1 GNAT family N-acetyltransferase [Helcobacillus sp. ACRRO]MCT1557673.1 GNAT family N-acetyltransferase [Helcobacillus massiliensis]MCT2035945.1 GNAT family N-acetyltransferase [Helcobacillus massiliensis]MCT2331785.1 GNAT family N-acetyltransferase [Helcobacillus massiliensis]